MNKHVELAKGAYRARYAQDACDVGAVQKMRAAVFYGETQKHTDADEIDALCQHALIEDINTGELVCSFRLLLINKDQPIAASYAAKYYDLAHFNDLRGDKLEIGRFCLAPNCHDMNVIRMAWAMITRFVDAHNIKTLFGCASFTGVDVQPYEDALAYLRKYHLAPVAYAPRLKAPKTYPYAADLADREVNTPEALRSLPKLLRSYLGLGGWVGDHVVMDYDMDTFHVFTAVEIANIPQSRARILRAQSWGNC